MDETPPAEAPSETLSDIEPVPSPSVLMQSTAGTQAQSAWDGNWPAIAAVLPVRGVAHQLAQQSELTDVSEEGGKLQFHLRVPFETLLSAGSSDKLATALTAHLDRPVGIKTSIGAVRNTAHAEAVAEQAQRQQQAEKIIENDPFVQTLVREFGATIIPGSIRPV